MLPEVLDALQVHEGKKYIDGTLGFGGHTEEIIRKGGSVLGIDVDEEALKFVTENIKKDTLKIAQGNFKDIKEIAIENGFEKVNGILLDLGVSSYQIDSGERGFSFQQSGPLDMRMDKNLSVSAKELVNGLTQKELAEVFWRFGEEQRSRVIAGEIVKVRAHNPITSTDELARIAERVYGFRISSAKTRAGSAKKIFQALRILVNDELHALESGIEGSVSLLEKGGRLVIISYHSLEDRIVKDSFDALGKSGVGEVVTKKPLIPAPLEIEANKRSRSAKLRIFEKN